MLLLGHHECPDQILSWYSYTRSVLAKGSARFLCGGLGEGVVSCSSKLSDRLSGPGPDCCPDTLNGGADDRLRRPVWQVRRDDGTWVLVRRGWPVAVSPDAGKFACHQKKCKIAMNVEKPEVAGAWQRRREAQRAAAALTAPAASTTASITARHRHSTTAAHSPYGRAVSRDHDGLVKAHQVLGYRVKADGVDALYGRAASRESRKFDTDGPAVRWIPENELINECELDTDLYIRDYQKRASAAFKASAAYDTDVFSDIIAEGFGARTRTSAIGMSSDSTCSVSSAIVCSLARAPRSRATATARRVAHGDARLCNAPHARPLARDHALCRRRCRAAAVLQHAR